MYKIDENTGKHVFLRNWNRYMQTEINYIESYINFSEKAQQSHSASQCNSTRHNKLNKLDDNSYYAIIQIIGEDPSNSTMKYREIYNKLLLRQSTFILSISLFESKLEELCDKINSEYLNLHDGETESFEDYKKRFNGGILDCLKSFLEEIAKIEFDITLRKQWSTFKTLYNIRNEIVHNFGGFKTFSNASESIKKISETKSGNKELNKLLKYLKYIINFIDYHKTIELKNNPGFEENTLFLKDNFFSATLIPFYRDFVTSLSNVIEKKINH